MPWVGMIVFNLLRQPPASSFPKHFSSTSSAMKAEVDAPLPEDHPLYQGGLPFAIGPLAEHLDGHDLAVVVCAPVFRYYPCIPGDYLPDGMRLWQVTDDPQEAGRAPVGDSILGDPVLTIEQLLPLVPQGARSQPLKPPLPHRMSSLPQTSAGGNAVGLPAAREVFDELRRICPANAVLVEETPSDLGDLHAAWPVTQPDAFYTMASGGLGWSTSARRPGRRAGLSGGAQWPAGRVRARCSTPSSP